LPPVDRRATLVTGSSEIRVILSYFGDATVCLLDIYNESLGAESNHRLNRYKLLTYYSDK
jgi:hypothetical protein